MPLETIRNFCIIAHIDHGKSTLADRLLQLTGTISDRDMMNQVLDDMELEREKGVTIKASAVRMVYIAKDGKAYQLNLIDTPGHVDFGYEVSRALNACEGALLVIDASQGIEAQTLANLYLALDAGLEILPIVNKIDLPGAQPNDVSSDISNLLGIADEQILQISAKAGLNVEAVLTKIVDQLPPPKGDSEAPTRALIFDSHYDPYKGVIAYIRVTDGNIHPTEQLLVMSTGVIFKPVEIGIFSPNMRMTTKLETGEVGYVATGLKSVRECRVGDTLTSFSQPAKESLPGYRKAKPMVFAGVYPSDSEEYSDLRDALEKLQLNDASLQFEPETSKALGFGFRCGFLGMFHMEIIQERLEREYDLNVVFTAPSVEYEVLLQTGDVLRIDSPADLPDANEFIEIREPWMQLQVFTPIEYFGIVMEITTRRRGVFIQQEYPAPNRVLLSFEIPLSELIIDYFDVLKSRTRGYASLDYQFIGYKAENLVRVELLVNEESVDAFSTIVHRDNAYHKGQAMVSKLKEIIPRQLFAVPIQAFSDGRVISRANIKALRKDVLAKCYGGDITRKRKLLESQKRGKRRMKKVGSVEIPQEAFLVVLRLDQE